MAAVACVRPVGLATILACLAAAALAAGEAAQTSDARDAWVNLTMYRVTPVGYAGLTNMDSGNAAGDVYFGISQLLLPQICPTEVWSVTTLREHHASACNMPGKEAVTFFSPTCSERTAHGTGLLASPTSALH